MSESKRIETVGLVWYNEDQDLIAWQEYHDPAALVQLVYFAEPILSNCGCVWHQIAIHDFDLLGWELIGEL